MTRPPTEAALLPQAGRANNEAEEDGQYVLMQQNAEDQKAQNTEQDRCCYLAVHGAPRDAMTMLRRSKWGH